jgi:hypothetical protein
MTIAVAAIVSKNRREPIEGWHDLLVDAVYRSSPALSLGHIPTGSPVDTAHIRGAFVAAPEPRA